MTSTMGWLIISPSIKEPTMKNAFLTFSLFCLSAPAFAIGANDAILGNGDTFACDTFARSAKVACMPGVNSNYRGRTSFPTQGPLVIGAFQVIECSSAGGDRDVVCSTSAGDISPGPGPGPGPGFPPSMPETRKAYTDPDFRCLRNLEDVDHADNLVSDAFFPSPKKVDRCENDRDASDVRRLERRGFTCVIDSLARNESNQRCVDDLLSKIRNKNSIKGGHRRRLETVYCAQQTFDCTRQ
jgi:hypothetical protein